MQDASRIPTAALRFNISIDLTDADATRTIAWLYHRLDEKFFEHDFENIVFNEGVRLDDWIGTLGLHTIDRSLKTKDQQGVVLSSHIRRRFDERPYCEVEAEIGGACFDLI